MEGRHTTIRLDEDIYLALMRAAKKERRTRTSAINFILAEHLRKHGYLPGETGSDTEPT